MFGLTMATEFWPFLILTWVHYLFYVPTISITNSICVRASAGSLRTPRIERQPVGLLSSISAAEKKGTRVGPVCSYRQIAYRLFRAHGLQIRHLGRTRMPWKECKPMDERLKFVARLLEGEKMAPLCREFGIYRVTGNKIFNRYGV